MIGTVVLIEKLMLCVSYKKIGVARSHFCAHNYIINLFVIVTGKLKKNSLVFKLVQLGGVAFLSWVP